MQHVIQIFVFKMPKRWPCTEDDDLSRTEPGEAAGGDFDATRPFCTDEQFLVKQGVSTTT